MIKLFIQGRKDGYKVLYPKPTPSEFFQFAGDLRPDGNNNIQLLGKSFFSIAFSPGGYIFTKQLIIQDVQRQGLGNIGVSLFISAQKKIAGEQMIQLLDELVKTYALNYCPDYYLDYVQEDWTIFEKIVTKYSSNLQVSVDDDQENLQPGAEDPAFLYYSDKLELAHFFDAPAQEEYMQFKQVFFIDKLLENQSYNPLKAIRHSLNWNLTGKIDLNNLSYKVRYNSYSPGGVRLDVQVYGKSLFNKSKIKRNDQLEITWSKPYHETRIKKGTCVEIGSTYLLINEDSRTITIKDITLTESTFKFQVKAINKFSLPIVDAELIAFSSITKKEISVVNNSITLREEQLNENYYVFGKKGNLISEPKALTKMGANEEITLTLLETVKLTIKPLDNRNSNYLPDAKINFVNKSNSVTGHSAEFRGDEVNKNWQIIISHPEYRTKTITYCPATEPSELVIQLEKLPQTEATSHAQQERKSYKLVIDSKKGKETWKGDALDLSGREFQQEDIRCDTRYGYKFSGWKIVEIKGQLEIYEAIFEDLWYRKVPKVVWGILPVLIAVGAYFLLKDIWKPEILTDGEKIEKYLAGSEMKLDSLISLKKICKIDSTFLSKNNDLCVKLDYAIAFRRYLDNGNLDSLLKHGSDTQSNPEQKEIITKIDGLLLANDKDTSSISKISWNVKDSNLDEIGERIDSLIGRKMFESPENQQEEKDSASADRKDEEKVEQSSPDNQVSTNPISKDSPSPKGENKKESAEFNTKLNTLLKQEVFPTKLEWKAFLKDINDENNIKKVNFIIQNIDKIKVLSPEDRKDYESIKREIN